MSKKMSAFRDLATSLVIGWLSTYLPFWEWDSIQTQFICGFAITILVLGLLEFADEMEEKYGRK